MRKAFLVIICEIVSGNEIEEQLLALVKIKATREKNCGTHLILFKRKVITRSTLPASVRSSVVVYQMVCDAPCRRRSAAARTPPAPGGGGAPRPLPHPLPRCRLSPRSSLHPTPHTPAPSSLPHQAASRQSPVSTQINGQT